MSTVELSGDVAMKYKELHVRSLMLTQLLYLRLLDSMVSGSQSKARKQTAEDFKDVTNILSAMPNQKDWLTHVVKHYSDDQECAVNIASELAGILAQRDALGQDIMEEHAPRDDDDLELVDSRHVKQVN